MNVLEMNSKENIQTNCKQVLVYYGLPTAYLGDVLNRHYINKQWILDALGIGEKDGYRKVFNLANTADTRPLAVGLLQDIERLSEHKYRFLDLQFMWKEKNKIRVTKIIQSMWGDLVKDACVQWRRDCTNTFFAKCCGEAKILHPLNMETNQSSAEEDIHKFHVWYGDYVKNGRVAVLSLNPFDFITASDGNHEFCGFTSCIRPDGEYANTILSYLASDCVAIMYTAKPENLNFKEGRCVVYINPNAVFQGREYGSIFDSDLLLVRDHIQQKLLPDDNYDLFGGEGRSSIAKWTKRSGKLTLQGNDCCNDGSGYLDYGYGIMSIVKGTPEQTFFRFKEGTCLECGGDIDGHEAGYACCDCATDGYRCEECERGISEDDACYVNDGSGPYCEDCFSGFAFYCGHCGEGTHDDYRICIENGSYICESCFSDIGFTCSHCECNFISGSRCGDNEPRTGDSEGNQYCQRCADRYLVICEECEECIHVDKSFTTHDDVYLCSDCFTQSTYKSFNNKIFHSEDERDRYNEENASINGQDHGEKVAACG